MVTPSSLQVRNRYENARIVKSLSSFKNFEFEGSDRIYYSQEAYWYRNDDETSELIWDNYYGFAKILETN
jgi:hypothetical protein